MTMDRHSSTVQSNKARPVVWWALALAMIGAPAAAASAQSRAALDRVPSVERAARRGTDAPAAEQQPVAFWESLGDTTLVRLLAEALRANPDVDAARARLSGARAARLGAALDLTPAVTASGGYSRQRLASATFPGAPGGSLPEQGLWDAGLRMSWEVDVFGRLRHSVRGRGELASAAHEGLRDVQVLLAAQVAGAYFDLRGAQDRLTFARRNAENQRGTLELTLQRIEAGRGTELDSERARAQLSTTLAEIPALEARIAAARHRIGVLAGRSPDAFAEQLAAAPPELVLPEVPVIASPEALVRQRPDVRSAERLVAAQSAFVGAARADYLPRVALGGAAGYTGSRFDALGNSGTPRYAFGPVVSWAAFDLGRVRAGVDEARAGEAEAKALYQQAVLQSLEEVETTLATYRGARERLRHLEDAAAASERAAELARLRYEEGASDFLPVLDAERTLLEAQDRLAVGRAEATAGLVGVYRALGGAAPTGR